MDEITVVPEWTLPGADGVALTRSEAKVLRLLHKHVGKLVAHEALWRELYWTRPEADWPEGDKIIPVFVTRLRQKLKATAWRITNVWGQGYRLETEAGETIAA